VKIAGAGLKTAGSWRAQAHIMPRKRPTEQVAHAQHSAAQLLQHQVISTSRSRPRRTCVTCVAKIVQGVRMRPNPIPNKETLAMLWAHKALRVFSDCLIDDSIDDDDRKYFVAAWASTHSRSRSR